MPDLSACYFCGTALDEPLSEYPVVPLTLTPAPEDQKTVVLCSVCRRKLGKVLDVVMDSIEERPLEATVQQDLDAASEEGTGEPFANDDGVDAGGADPGGADDEPTDEWTSGDEMREDAAATKETRAATKESGTAAEDEPQVAAEDEQEADDGDAAEGPPPGSDGTDEEEDGPELTALEYTKVMRLLENRDLPVDREEFRIVATNAYEITPEEFDLVVDAAIDRGLIVEEDGQFVAFE